MPGVDARAARLPEVAWQDPRALEVAGASTSAFGTGGMRSKVLAASARVSEAPPATLAISALKSSLKPRLLWCCSGASCYRAMTMSAALRHVVLQ